MFIIQKYNNYLEINEKLAKKWPNITQMIDPPEDADEWAKVDNKYEHLKPYVDEE